MAIITEYQDHIDPPKTQLRSRSRSRSKPKPKPKPEPKPDPKTHPPPPTHQTTNPFTFWFYLTITVSLITLFFILLSTLSKQDQKTWFLNLPTNLRTHFSNGRPIKVQINQNGPPIQVFTYSKGSRTSENVLIVHGLGCNSFSFRRVIDDLGLMGFHVSGFDLPGSGFSDKVVVTKRESLRGGVLGGFWEVYDEIKEKGIFWHFDNLIEKGYIEEGEKGGTRVSVREVVEPIEMGVEEVGRVLSEVIDSLGLAPLHLVLHDSGLVMGANWVVENVGSLRSLTLVDVGTKGVPALPFRVFEVPVVREVVLGFDFVFRKLIESCCSKMIGGSSLEGHRAFLKGSEGREAIVAMGKRLNQSFDFVEWVGNDGVKGLPMQVIWSESWSKEWSEEGKQVTEVVSHARFIEHSGGRWPQDDASSELAWHIGTFVSSLPKTDRRVDEEPLPDHIQKKLDEAKNGDHHHGYGSHDSHDDHRHGVYMNPYGRGLASGIGHGM